MPAVHPRARVRLRGCAIALTLSSTIIVGLASGPAEASTGPTVATTSSVAASLVSSTPGVLVADRVAAQSASEATAAQKAAAHKAAVKRAAAKKAAAHKAAVRRAAAKKKAAKLAFGIRVIRVASTYRGRPYQWGAAGPSRFDCSGFTRYVYAKFGIGLPHSSAAQYSVVRHVANSKKQVGDLVFFHSGSGHVYHVGIYAGGDRIWAATHTGDFVRLEGMWNASYYVGRV